MGAHVEPWGRRAKRSAEVRGKYSLVVGAFAVLREIQSLALLLFAHAQTDGRLDDLQDHISHQGTPCRRCDHTQELYPNLVQRGHPLCIPDTAEPLSDEYSCKRRSKHAANSMNR